MAADRVLGQHCDCGPFLLAGLALGAPATLTSPLVETDINMTTGIVWLIAVAYSRCCIPHPALCRRRSRGGWCIVVRPDRTALAARRVMFFPNTGLFTVVGYASIGTGLPGAVLAALTLVVATVALGLMMRVTLAPWQGFEVPPFRRLNHPRWRVSVVAGWSVYCRSPRPDVGVGRAVGRLRCRCDDRGPARDPRACRLRGTPAPNPRNDPLVAR